MATTVGDFVAGGLLYVLGEPPGPPGSREVDTVLSCEPGWRLPHRPERRRLLVIAPADGAPSDLAAALRALARQGAVAVSIGGDAAGLDMEEVSRAAAACDLVALAAPDALSSAQMAGALAQRQAEVYRRRSEVAREIFRVTAESHRLGEGPRRLLDYVQRTTGAQLDVISRGGLVWEELVQGGELPFLNRLVDGGIRAHTFTTSGPPSATDASHAPDGAAWTVSLHALQGMRPHPVLYARAPGVLPPATLELFEQTAVQAGMLHDAVRRRETAQMAADTRAAVLQYLLMGEVTVAARVGERLSPGVLSRETGRAAIVECGRTEQREDVAAACATVVDPSLIAPCPAYERHLILALPADDAGDDAAARTVLAQLAEDGRAIGVSTARPWPRTVLSYQSAFRALSAARASTGRIALDEGEPVAALLPSRARLWGRRMYGRLSVLPDQYRGVMVHTAQIALAHGDTQAGKLMGVRRTTAGTRLSEVMGAMGLKRGSLVHRAVADLALQLAALPEHADDDQDDRPVSLDEELLGQSSATARSWAGEYLAPLDERLLRVVTTYLARDGKLGEAAEDLGADPKTMRRWLDQAGARLSRALRAPGEGAHDPLWALLLTGHLSVDILPTTTPAVAP